MAEYKDVKVSRILNPTSIDLGEFVINPYKGCEYGCLYCYVRSNRTTARETRQWGSYVDIRSNAVERLEKEIVSKRPECVLIGSTTEAFQPIERRTGLTGKILEILNFYKVHYVILTRSPILAEYIPQLSEGLCKNIYFTVNDFDEGLKSKLEPKSPAFELRFKAIEDLSSHDIPVVPYFSPILPWVSDVGSIFKKLANAKRIEFEGLNFNLVNIRDIIDTISTLYPALGDRYRKLHKDRKFYETTWEEVRKTAVSGAIASKKSYNIYIHNFEKYFENSYQS